MSNKHPHDKVIRAWLDGKQIEVYSSTFQLWVSMRSMTETGDVPAFRPGNKYRIAPEKGYQYTFTTSDGYLAITPRRFASLEEAAKIFPGKDLQPMDGTYGLLKPWEVEA